MAQTVDDPLHLFGGGVATVAKRGGELLNIGIALDGAIIYR